MYAVEVVALRGRHELEGEMMKPDEKLALNILAVAIAEHASKARNIGDKKGRLLGMEIAAEEAVDAVRRWQSAGRTYGANAEQLLHISVLQNTVTLQIL
ncbi:hypothetical protein LCGC14_2043280 [marine sediment metagenome]|uniref:Uncharacterized protein n=1 Tax=marine sediment metagenome TaxID=412755 RepID=A0A0F9H4N6_9ZZZZ